MAAMNGSAGADDRVLPDFLGRHGSRIFDERFSQSGGRFRFDGQDIACRDGILRFTPDQSYSTGNFSRLRDAHPTLQLDSRTGLDISYRTVVERCNWPPEFFRDRLVLECGCGAGPDTEALLRLGAQVVSVDLAGTDVARRNVGDGQRNIFIQCSITDLPFRKGSFDIVFCHRVLQHTPDPAHTLRHILAFVREGGAVFVHSYARNRAQMLGWKYVLRPITTRMDPDRLYRLIRWYVPPLLRLGTRLARIRPPLLGRLLFQLSQYVLPLYNYRHWPVFAGKPDEYVVEYAIHNTFDALSPRYDIPMSARRMREIAAAALTSPFEVVELGGIVLLRTLIGTGTSAAGEGRDARPARGAGA